MFTSVLKKAATFASAGVIAATLGFGGAANAQTFYMQNDANLKAGMVALMAGELENASTYLTKATKTINGGDRLQTAFSNLCAVDLALGKYDTAKKACDEAISADHHDWRAYVNRGHVNRVTGETNAALKDYRRAAKLNPNSDLTRRVLASYEAGLNTTELASND